MSIDLSRTRLFRTLVGRYAARFEYIRMKLMWLSLLGIGGFPGYYLVWTYLYPQPYENLWLRLGGSGLCALILAAEYWPGLLGRYYAAYAYITISLILPFFFTYMLLCNGANAVWLGSAVCGILYLTLMHDPFNLVVTFLAGTGLGVGVFLATPGNTLPAEFMPAIPVIMFALAGGIVLNYSAEQIARMSLHYGVQVGSSIAHEMRTPLLSIRMDTSTCQEMMPTLLEAHRWARANGWPGPALDPFDIEDIEGALTRIRHQTGFANTMVDMLLVNVRGPTPALAQVIRQSMAGVIQQALATYPFREHERKIIHWQPGEDFIFAGSDMLMRHVLFNLFKNALRAIAEVKRGEVVIRLEKGASRNRLIVRDTGAGMPPAVQANVFQPFYSGGTDNTRIGIGLTFCRQVIDGIGGSIVCRSEPGAFTEFEITLPAVAQPESAASASVRGEL